MVVVWDEIVSVLALKCKSERTNLHPPKGGEGFFGKTT